MNNIKKDFEFLIRDTMRLIESNETVQKIKVFDNNYIVYVLDGRPISVINIENTDEYYNNIYAGSFYINKLCKILGVYKNVKITGLG
jgi:hypothetical protein